MFQNTDPTAVARLSIASLLACLVVLLSGCAGMHLDSDLHRAVTGGYRSSETLAVLLPQSGRFAGAAKVVRNGIVAAQEADPREKRPALRFYDSASGSVKALVQRAAADGASLVIGPLQKPEVDALASLSALQIPVLALNHASAGSRPPPHFYQFSLLPEGEAVEVAAKARGAGYRTALMLYPDSAWGNRISRAFRQSWKAQGGRMAATQAYDPSATDFSGSITKLTEPAAGADFLFLIATARNAHQIFAQVRQRIGEQIPVYSTSHIFGRRFDPRADGSLAGLNVVEMPWLVEPVRGDRVSSKGLDEKLPRLYAMGVDAYRLGSRLQWMSQRPGARILGKTGILSMDSRGRIYRQLTLVRIESGGLVKIAVTDTAGSEAFAWAVPLEGAGPRLAAVGSSNLGVVRP